jgi:hypothetical protein
MLSGPYAVINQLIKSIWKATHLDLFILYMLGGKKHQSNKKWPRLGLLKIRSKFGHSKVHSYLLVKVLVVVFLIHICFSIMYHILSPYKNYLRSNHNKNCIWMLMWNPNLVTLKVHYYMIGVCLLDFNLY